MILVQNKLQRFEILVSNSLIISIKNISKIFKIDARTNVFLL